MYNYWRLAWVHNFRNKLLLRQNLLLTTERMLSIHWSHWKISSGENQRINLGELPLYLHQYVINTYENIAFKLSLMLIENSKKKFSEQNEILGNYLPENGWNNICTKSKQEYYYVTFFFLTLRLPLRRYETLHNGSWTNWSRRKSRRENISWEIHQPRVWNTFARWTKRKQACSIDFLSIF